MVYISPTMLQEGDDPPVPAPNPAANPMAEPWLPRTRRAFCYWARLSRVSGDVDEIIANEHAIGPFSVTVQATNLALETE